MDSNEKLTARIHLKVTESTFDGLKKIQDQHRLTPQDVLRGLAEAAVEFYEKNGYFVFPVKIEPTNAVLFGKIESAVSGHGASGTLNARIINPQEPISKLTKRSRK